jgi:hypothetical protein
MGIDIADIRCIIHLGRTRTLLDYAQESGRAGRDGQGSEAIMIIPMTEPPPPWDPTQGPSEEDQALVQQYIDGEATVRDHDIGTPQPPACRRVVLDRYLDGSVDGYIRVQCEASEARCDQCQPDWELERSPEVEVEIDSNHMDGEDPIAIDVDVDSDPETDFPASVEDSPHSPGAPIPIAMTQTFRQQEQARRVPIEQFRQRQQHEQMELEWLRQELAGWIGRCHICHRFGYANHDGHELLHCPRVESQAAKTWAGQVKRQIYYEKYSGCFYCGVPQAICHRWRENDQGGFTRQWEQACQYEGILIPMVAAMLHGQDASMIQPQWRERLHGFGVDDTDIDQVAQYLGKKTHEQTVERNQLVAEFCWLRQIFAQFD